MDWINIYKNLIETAKKENRSKSKSIYFENHHIIPRYMQGSNDNDNLQLLTFREHILAHYLLWRIHGNTEDQIMYKMRGGQREEAQRLRSARAVAANRNGGDGFLKKGGWNPMKNKETVKKF